MDTIDIFVDHFVIHSDSREALILNGSVDTFKSNLRELVSSEVRSVLLEHVSLIDDEITRKALMDVHNSLLFN